MLGQDRTHPAHELTPDDRPLHKGGGGSQPRSVARLLTQQTAKFSINSAHLPPPLPRGTGDPASFTWGRTCWGKTARTQPTNSPLTTSHQ